MAQRPGPQSEDVRKTSSSPAEPLLPEFSDPSFDPVDFLNDTLPPLSTSQSRSAGGSSIADVSALTQSLLSQLTAQNARLSNSLNQLTDEIIRSSGRLAYEVEVLRGETIGLSDTLTDTLQDDIRSFLPQGLPEPAVAARQEDVHQEENEENESGTKTQPEITQEDPEYISRLRTLMQVRTRLEEVIQVFGDAMEWPLPPSEVSITSSFISVSAPEAGPESRSLEEKGREVAKKFRSQVTGLLDSNGGGEAGLEAAARRVEELRLLAGVWKGTVEEKPRLKFVDSLAKIVEDRRKVLENQAREKEERENRKAGGTASKGRTSELPSREKSESTGSGLMRNLQRLRDEIYLE
ncbi:hypothetical protein H112_07578 [Trichophyton rubrum D6]|uniref:Uncharacterized protein n=4 Tax=Trichophyton TaxID=5550 RepID=A0A178EWK6_TRIRU|nr:uncharacterized protein TERG_00179 [Trichophyton rubrum CBS 118892]EZF11288.1 hypothetical protein H100_07605 [Trichophyton rubrum MR850]EZF38215.1 hypothetical protein H102_07569 [Trichophyton rubrum CBS 100081]EZF48767.1 hypothetical protein H103_07591 [Trichophyton rubrum CBS 288.86]EZF59462.1 hypothetical protein H104_07540 [Trichophyton rubrum CBS 289.86]EZF70070.1 hypothetical protein H105_07596 [Trichophyton soudanense CBS 452.61]EZF91368.1 hypothetical protein H113_07646 [Trichophy